MDLSLWEPSDGEDHHMFFVSNYHVGGVGNFVVEDVIEEDSLNEKSCVQVLRILIDKADEEIMKLEEDIVMLQCRLAWDDEDWSKPCSVALQEKIDHLDILIQSLKKEITEEAHYLAAVQIEQPEKLARRLHDFVKPLLENYLLVKRKQPPDLMAKSLIASTSIEKAGSRETDGKENNAAEEVITKLEIAQLKLEHESTESNSHLESRETERKIAEIVKPAEETIEATMKIRKARACSRAIGKNALLPTKPLVKTERKTTKLPDIREAVKAAQRINMNESLRLFLFNHKPKHACRAEMNLEHKRQVRQRPKKKCKTEEVDIESQEEFEVLEKISKKENSSISSQIIEEPGVGKNLLLRIKDVEKLTLNDLRIIAKNQKLPGYYRLRKKELQQRLGLEAKSK